MAHAEEVKKPNQIQHRQGYADQNENPDPEHDSSHSGRKKSGQAKDHQGDDNPVWQIEALRRSATRTTKPVQRYLTLT
jgi:hypothetical protein